MKHGDIVGLVIVFFIIGALAAFFVLAPKADRLAYGPVEVTGSALQKIQPSGNGVEVTVTIKQKGFVTIHEALGTAPGAIIGVTPLLVEGDQSLAIAFTKALEPGMKYVALLMVDDGDGVYEPGIDKPVMSGGDVVKGEFEMGEGL